MIIKDISYTDVCDWVSDRLINCIDDRKRHSSVLLVNRHPPQQLEIKLFIIRALCKICLNLWIAPGSFKIYHDFLITLDRTSPTTKWKSCEILDLPRLSKTTLFVINLSSSDAGVTWHSYNYINIYTHNVHIQTFTTKCLVI